MTASTLIERIGAEPSGGPDWLVELRRAAAAAVRDGGLPHKKVEAWRFTPVKPIVDTAFTDAEGGEVPAWAASLLAADDGCFRLFVVNGQPLAVGEAPAGVTVRGLADLLADNGEDLAGRLGAIAEASHFAAVNAALFSDGLMVSVDAGAVVERPVHVVHVSVAGTDATACYPRLLVVGGENSQATVIETYLATDGPKQLVNAVTEVDLAPRAQLQHVRVQRGGQGSLHVGQLAIRQDRDSVYRSCSVSLGGQFARVDVHARLAGQGAECALDGVYHTAGTELCDHHTFIDHVEPHCSSSENYRGVVDGASRAVFDGTIVVRRDAQKTSAHQENRNLLLSDDATVHTKPHLEIDADDIVASHGATVGALDDAQLFYLRARGLDESTARAALTYGFIAAVLDGIDHQAIGDWLRAGVRHRLPDGDRIEELLV